MVECRTISLAIERIFCWEIGFHNGKRSDYSAELHLTSTGWCPSSWKEVRHEQVREKWLWPGGKGVYGLEKRWNGLARVGNNFQRPFGYF